MTSGQYKRRPERLKKNVFFTSVVAAVILASWFTKFNPWEIVANGDIFLSFFTKDFFPPKFLLRWEIAEALLVTVTMSLAASFSAFFIAGLLSFLGSDVTTPWPFCGKLVRGLASFLRNIPALVWAFILFMSFGVGITVGYLALLVSSVGFLTRAFIETVNETSPDVEEAAVALGAGYWQRIFCLIFPGVISEYISWLLYNLELNIRSSSIVGMVGGGGIGLVLFSYLKMYRYQAASGIILEIAGIVILVDWLTRKIRENVLTRQG
jgi:phosphonate transport system permease protein